MKHYPVPSRRDFLAGGLGTVLVGPAVLGQDKKQEDDCRITADNIEGPFWRPDSPYRTKLRKEGMEGDVLVVSGKVEGHPDCTPLEDALLDVWQADAGGRYDNEAPNHNPKVYRLRGRMKTDKKGRYEFETVKPGRYKIGKSQFRPSHIHFKVSRTGYQPLTTQLYFEGDPHIKSDPFVRKSLIMKVEKVEDEKEIKKRKLDGPFFACTFDIILAKLDKSGYGGGR